MAATKLNECGDGGNIVKSKTGPLSETGKARSAMNALRHGLGAVKAVLPGEDVELYAARADAFFAECGVSNAAEAELAALAFDDIWRLGRLAKVENALIHSRIEELAGQVDGAETASACAQCILSVGHALEAWAGAPIPLDRGEDLSERVRLVRKAMNLIMDTLPDFPLDGLAEVERLLLRTRDHVAYIQLAPELHRQVQDAVRVVLTALLDRGAREDSRQDGIRQAIATIALPADSELKKVERYRRALELSLQRRLQTLEQMRRLTTSRPPQHDAEKAREFRIRLRLVV